MAQCPECFGQVPDGAKRCMHCGSRLGGPPTWLTILIILISLAIIGGTINFFITSNRHGQELEECLRTAVDVATCV